MIAQGDHMPVHLGSMPMAVAAALREIDLQPGDVVALNDPFAGGTHLPDVTLVMPVCSVQWAVGSEDPQNAERSKKRLQHTKSQAAHCPLPTAHCFLRRQSRAPRRHRRRNARLDGTCH